MFFASPLAEFPPPSQLAPLLAIVAAFMIPIIVILTRHQQKMTALMHRDALPTELPPQTGNQDLLAVQYEVQQLRSIVSSLALSVDSLKNEVQRNSALQDRVKIEQ